MQKPKCSFQLIQKKKKKWIIKLDIYSFVKHKIQPTSFLLSVDLLQFFVDEIMT